MFQDTRFPEVVYNKLHPSVRPFDLSLPAGASERAPNSAFPFRISIPNHGIQCGTCSRFFSPSCGVEKKTLWPFFILFSQYIWCIAAMSPKHFHSTVSFQFYTPNSPAPLTLISVLACFLSRLSNLTGLLPQFYWDFKASC